MAKIPLANFFQHPVEIFFVYPLGFACTCASVAFRLSRKLGQTEFEDRVVTGMLYGLIGFFVGIGITFSVHAVMTIRQHRIDQGETAQMVAAHVAIRTRLQKAIAMTCALVVAFVAAGFLAISIDPGESSPPDIMQFNVPDDRIETPATIVNALFSPTGDDWMVQIQYEYEHNGRTMQADRVSNLESIVFVDEQKQQLEAAFPTGATVWAYVHVDRAGDVVLIPELEPWTDNTLNLIARGFALIIAATLGILAIVSGVKLWFAYNNAKPILAEIASERARLRQSS